MALADLIAALRARWREQLLIVVLVVAAIAAWTSLSPRLYQATTTLLYDDRANDPTDDESRSGRPVDMAQVLSTQGEIIRSEAVVRKVVRSEQLLDVAKDLGVGKRPAGIDPETWLADHVRRNLSVDAGRRSNVLAVSYTSKDSALSARVANAFAANYIDAQLQLRVDPAKAYSEWFEGRTREARERLERAQAALADFQRANGFADAGTMEAELTRLSELSTQLAQAEANAADVRSRAGVDAASSADVQSTHVIQQLRTTIAAQAKKIADLSATYGPRHPAMVAAQSEMATLRARLVDETRQAQASLSVSANAAVRRKNELERLVQVQRGKMVMMSGARNQMQVLEGDVASARAAYDATTQRLTALRLQSELPRTNVRQLDQAEPPLKPSSPRTSLRLVLAFVLGVMAAVSWAVWREWTAPRVRTTAGLRLAAGSHFVATIDLEQSAVTRLLKKAA